MSMDYRSVTLIGPPARDGKVSVSRIKIVQFGPRAVFALYRIDGSDSKNLQRTLVVSDIEDYAEANRRLEELVSERVAAGFAVKADDKDKWRV
jgi:hypothetical protein